MMPSALGSKSVACVVVSCLVLGTLPALAQSPSAPAPKATVTVPPPAAAPAAVAPAPAIAPAPAAPPPEAMPPAPAEAAPTPPPGAAPPMEPLPGALPPPPEGPPPPPEAPPPPSKAPAYVLWGLGGASLIVGGAFGIAALSEKSRFDDAPTYGKANAVHSDTVASDVGLGLGVVLLVSGTIFYFMKDSDSGTDQQANQKTRRFASVSVDPMIGQKTRGGTLTLKF